MDEDKKPGKAKRHVTRKKLYICVESKNDPSSFEAVSGPEDGIPGAVKTIKDNLPDGVYVLMYEGKRIQKSSVEVSDVRTIEEEE